jgi:hypothetical protein
MSNHWNVKQEYHNYIWKSHHHHGKFEFNMTHKNSMTTVLKILEELKYSLIYHFLSTSPGLKWFGVASGNEKSLGYVEPVRANFTGRSIRSPITGELGEIYFPANTRTIRQLIGWVLLFMVLSVSIWLVVGIAKLRAVLVLNGVPLAALFTGWLNTIQINVFNYIGMKLAKKLNDWENYPTRRRFCNALIVKLFIFRFVNCFNVFFYIG